MTGYQWAVVFAAWLGWGFDIIDALLFNYVSGNCVPTLLGLTLGSPEARAATQFWSGLLTSVLLLGWAAGGIFFGWLADRIGRTRTLLITILLYSLGTAMCALAPNIYFLVVCRIFSSLGIGGEWAAGAALVSEVVPRSRRVESGALLYTSAPFGLVCAALINKLVAGWWLRDHPEYSWRVVFLFGLLPALAAAGMRMVLKEPESFASTTHDQVRIGDLFKPDVLARTRSGVLMAATALLAWWTLTAFMPYLAGGLAEAEAHLQNLDAAATTALVEAWKLRGTAYFSVGGFLGTLLTVPVSNRLGRKPMFGLYFAASALAIFVTFGLPLRPDIKLMMQFFVGLTVFGVFGSFTYYLPELFPARLRATGAGFCYNVGRVVTAFGPFLVGRVASGGLESVQRTLLTVVLVPLFGLAALPWVVETRDQPDDPESAPSPTHVGELGLSSALD